MPLLWAAAAASAAPDCAEPLTAEDLRVRLDSVDHAFAIDELSVAERVTTQLHERVTCLQHVADPAALRQLAWYEAWIAWRRKDEDAALAAIRSALVAGASPDRGERPARTMPAVIPPADPFREFADAEVLPPVIGEGSLRPPRGGGVFLSGALLHTVRSFADTPMLLQVADEHGDVVSASWVVGDAFPADLVAPPGEVAKTPRWWTEDVDFEATPTVVRQRRDLGKLPNVLAALVVGGAAGGLYAVAAGSEGRLGAAADEASLAAARTRTNTLVVASGAAAAVAAGVGITVFLAAPGVGVAVRF